MMITLRKLSVGKILLPNIECLLKFFQFPQKCPLELSFLLIQDLFKDFPLAFGCQVFLISFHLELFLNLFVSFWILPFFESMPVLLRESPQFGFSQWLPDEQIWGKLFLILFSY